MVTPRQAGLVALRYVLLTVMFFVVLSLIMAIARPEVGALEKVALGGAMVGLIAFARPIQRIG